tara:strand:+ start:1405 stop:4122 length:2718 start_codon:yes stop_codon:yes gene_type:complete
MAATNKKKIFLIDGMALIYRAHYAMVYNQLTTSSGIHTSAVFGFINSLFKILNDEKPDFLAICSDSKGPTFRHERYDMYKANRKEMPDELKEQIPILYNIFEKSNIPLLMLTSYEADDIIGTFSKLENSKENHTYIVSGDKDLMQLVDENTSIYSLGNKFKPTTIYNKNKVIDKWQLPPDKIIDYLALVGDSSDNVPGVAGVGPKTAVKLINEYGDVEGIYKSIESIKNIKLREKLISNKKNAWLSKELVTLDLNVPIDFDIDEMAISNFDFSLLKEELNKIEIYHLDSVLDKYIDGNSSIETFENVKKDRKYILVDEDKKIDRMLSDIKNFSIISIDLETTSLNPFDAKIVGMSLSVKENHAYYIPFIIPGDLFPADPKLILDKLSPIFNSSNYKLIGQNLKYDLLILKRHSVNIKNIYFDTYIAESLISPEKTSYKLDNLSIEYLGYKMQPIEDLIGEKKQKQILMSEVPTEKVCFYACEDADIVLKIYNKQKQILSDMNLENIFYNIEMPLIDVLIEMEYNGLFIDVNMIKELSNSLKKKIKKISDKIYSYANKEFNINSPKQLSEVLFDDLELKQIKKRSTASNVLHILKKYHPIAEELLEYRHLNKLVNTYLDTLPAFIHDNTERIHTTFNQAIVSTGRLSSNKPNFQNIPIKTDVGKEIRKAFIPQKDDHFIYSFDYSQIELRILTHFTGEKELLKAFKNEEDVHSKTASLIFNIEEKDVEYAQRQIAKTINYSILYGAGPFRISQELKISIKDASEIIKSYFNSYPQIKNYIDSTIEFGEKNGFVKTLNGRQRKVSNLYSSNKNIVEAEKRAMINMPIQGTASELIKVAMININRIFKEKSMKSKMILQIHDELLFEVPKDEIKSLYDIVTFEMEKAINLDVPIKVDSNYGHSWFEAH